ncbi:hypothetical protein BBK_4829 [Burkholderia pseudomallei NCTC 13179]|nr:hypothetical protein BBK_4829 [Burkholderia pseudomallei NCTC 13179]
MCPALIHYCPMLLPRIPVQRARLALDVRSEIVPPAVPGEAPSANTVAEWREQIQSQVMFVLRFGDQGAEGWQP